MPDTGSEATPWQDARGPGRATGVLNIGMEAADRHADDGHGAETVLIWLGKAGGAADGQLRRSGGDVGALRQCAARPWHRARRQPVRADGPDARALCRRPWHTEGRCDLHPAVLRLRAGAAPHPDGAGTTGRTRRALVVDEGWRSRSLAAEISARIMEQAFWSLDAPVCSAEVPIPYAKHLEEAAIPQVPVIVATAKSLVGRG